MIAVVIGVVVLILLFERRRARQIERDLKARAQPRHAPGGTEPQGVQPRENDRRES
ncbi:hypothetical protein [Nocardioides terrae]|nr:hypothetical protein [Nocardioides terrae]